MGKRKRSSKSSYKNTFFNKKYFCIISKIENRVALNNIDEIIKASAKTGEGVADILSAIIERIPPPNIDDGNTLKALIFDSVYNPFRGIEIYFRVFSGKISKGQQIKFCATGKNCLLYTSPSPRD